MSSRVATSTVRPSDTSLIFSPSQWPILVHSPNGARTGLTGFVAGLSRSVAKHNVTINNLLPGLFVTDTMTSRINAGAKMSGKTYDEVEAERLKPIAAGRFGNIEEFGMAAAFLCSAHGGYIVGQNLLMDGGAYGGTF